MSLDRSRAVRMIAFFPVTLSFAPFDRSTP
jgi:hypothetical protein